MTQRNWLEVYPYTNWGGNANLPVFTEGQRFMPSDLLLHQVGGWNHNLWTITGRALTAPYLGRP